LPKAPLPSSRWALYTFENVLPINGSTISMISSSLDLVAPKFLDLSMADLENAFSAD